MHGRVSDIWRSYFAQALFPRIQASVGFLPRPIVVQDRNPHSYEADFKAEIPLYTQANKLVSYLMENYANTTAKRRYTFIEIMEYLYIDMYERGFIEEQDVLNIQEWIVALLKIGYRFPSINSSYSNKRKKIERNISVFDYSRQPTLHVKEQFAKLGKNINKKEGDYWNFEHCDPFKYNLTFGTADRHDGPRIDISSTLLNMGQNFVQLGPELWKSHPSIFSKSGRNFKNNYPEVSKMKGMYFAQDNVSPPLRRYIDHSTTLDPDWPQQNYEFYRNDKLITNIDAFICTFPASMWQLWAPINKTIIFLPAHRYIVFIYQSCSL